MLAELLTLRPLPSVMLCCRPRSTAALRSSAKRERAARSSALLPVRPLRAAAVAADPEIDPD